MDQFGMENLNNLVNRSYRYLVYHGRLKVIFWWFYSKWCI